MNLWGFSLCFGHRRRGLHIMAAGLRSAGKWQRRIFSKRTVHLGFIYSNNRLAGVKLALDSFSVVGRMMDDKSSGATRNQRRG